MRANASSPNPYSTGRRTEADGEATGSSSFDAVKEGGAPFRRPIFGLLGGLPQFAATTTSFATAETIGSWAPVASAKLPQAPAMNESDNNTQLGHPTRQTFVGVQPPVNVAGSSSMTVPRGGFGTSRTRPPGNELTLLKPTAKDAYRNSRWYHGTSETSKKSIQRHGFDTGRKRGGATKAISKTSQVKSGAVGDAARHHYLAKDKDNGLFFAELAAPSNPALVRTLVISKRELGLESDPAIPRKGRDNPDVMRTASSIPANHVLGSKRNPPGSEGAVFQQALLREGMKVSERVAAQLLREVQSNSEDDEFEQW